MHAEASAPTAQLAARLTRRDVVVGLAAAAFGLLLNLAYVWHDLGFMHGPERVLEADHWRYLSMAQRPLGDSGFEPFCWRILVPWLASVLTELGVTLGHSFYGMTCAFLWIFLLSLYLHLRQRGFDERHALLGVFLGALVPGGVRWYLYQYPMPDPLCLTLVGLSLVAIHAHRHAWLLVLGVAGLATRESFLLVLPYFFLYRWQRDSLTASLRSTLLYFTVPLAALLAIRLWIDPSDTEDALATLQGLRGVARFRFEGLFDNQLYFATVGTFGVVLGAVLLLPQRLLRAARGRLPELAFLFGAYASLLQATNTDRLLVYALPVVLPAAIGQVVAYGRAASVPFLVSGAALLAVQLYVYDQTLYFEKPAVSVYQPTNAGVVGAVVLLWTVARLRLRWTRSQAPGLIERPRHL